MQSDLFKTDVERFFFLLFVSFNDLEILRRCNTDNGLERFDFRTDPHAHFICQVCGAVSDINWLELPADTLQEVEQQTGASVETCRIAVSGVCAACMKKDTQ